MPDADAPGAPATEQLRILVVDDRPENVLLLTRLLQRWGYDNVAATSHSSEVAELCEVEPPDLLLLDLHMPPPDGFEIMAQLEEQIRATVSLPVLVLTGDASEDVKRRA